MNINDLAKKLTNRSPSILDSEKFSKYAVLLPLVHIKGEIHVLFEVRSFQLRRQPGEICFPGGRIDKSDKDAQHTAVRETSEELGISENSITNISPLDYMISPFGTMIFPYVGFIETTDEIRPNPAEVAEVFTVPLSFFKDIKPKVFQVNFKVEPERDFPFKHIPGGENYNWQARKMEEYFFYYEDKVIWGLTAKILQHFIEITSDLSLES
ncbi:CoA pyrophosphatase [Bacillus sp. FJAT-29790]|uniref:NUDIX hydrolase n=1 Tax=Bacillus sp. FJAT-29790 TaxID=1895002 RepID=UPI001C23807A|nr:CoA pyrophosphatase [Bacillus sp. FJAT-29790]